MLAAIPTPLAIDLAVNTLAVVVALYLLFFVPRVPVWVQTHWRLDQQEWALYGIVGTVVALIWAAGSLVWFAMWWFPPGA